MQPVQKPGDDPFEVVEIKLGRFVTLGIVIIVVAIIWVGATKYFEKGDRYVAYFDESVQGLQKDSIVKYRGVDVGRVDGPAGREQLESGTSAPNLVARAGQGT